MTRLVLDTSAYSHLRHGHEEVLQEVAAAESVLMPMIVLGELESAFELGSKVRENRVLLDAFLREAFVSVLPVSRAVARRYGHVLAALRRSGTPIPTNDIWIAATVLDSGGHLLTFDGDFRKVEGLDCTVLRP